MVVYLYAMLVIQVIQMSLDYYYLMVTVLMYIETTLYYACDGGHTDILRLLLFHGDTLFY